MNSILVVCAGNICRSPMGEAFFKIALENRDFRIDSAGIVGLSNHPADENAIKVMKEVEIDITKHSGKRINNKLLAEYDLILVMTNQQVSEITSQYPFCKGRVFRLGHWLDMEIEDPYKRDENVFIKSRNDIKQSVDSWLNKL